MTSRRDFLKLSALSLGSLAFRDFLPPEDQVPPFGYGRVTIGSIRVRSEPSWDGEHAGWRHRDRVMPLLEEIISSGDPVYNPRWYRIVGGFVHSAYIQLVEMRYQKPLRNAPEEGQIAEVTVPYTQSLRYYHRSGWHPTYRLYYKSTHWITGIDEGPDSKPWYQLTDDRLRVNYFVPATHLRPVPDEEITPLSPDVDEDEKLIIVSLENQTVTCYEGDEPVFHSHVATGIHSNGLTENGIPTDTPQGWFRITWKMPVRHMGEGELTNALDAYELPGVPWCSFFVSTGVAFHGTYWHDNYGTRMSHGCVNMRPDEAKWLFRWSMPVNGPRDLYQDGVGTVVQVI